MNAFSLLVAAIELLAPSSVEPFRLIPDAQRALVTNATMAARKKVLADDSAHGKKLCKSDEWRKSRPLVLEWRATATETGPWEVQLGKKPDLSDARTFHIRKRALDPATGREVHHDGKPVGTYRFEVPYANLEIATTYYWRIASDITCGTWGHGRQCPCKTRKPSVLSAIGSFTTEDLAPRWIAIEGKVDNFRDLGGRRGLGGRRVRQGMVYRSQGLNNNSVDGCRPGRNRLTVEDVKLLKDDMGIRTDLDLRSNGETAGMKVSPLGPDVQFIHHPSSSYDGIFREDGKKVMAKNFRVFCDEKNYPILFHCIGGADRTGALGYVLNGVLGVDRQGLETDWESTFYPSIPDKDASGKLVWNSESHFNNGFGKYGDADATWNERIVLYLKDCGVTDAEIEKFRAIMLR